jgi:RNA polymerase sigma-70 factor (ECF subfamily)
MHVATGQVRADPGDEPWFQRVYAAHYDLILAYALRRTQTPDDAADVVAETFLTAWRRQDQAPDGDATRLWLYGIARRVTANHQRGRRRQERLAARLRAQPVTADGTDPEEGAIELRGSVMEAFERLRPADREILTLVAAEDLSPGAVARVLGCTQVAARVRLHRARVRFTRELRAAGVEV